MGILEFFTSQFDNSSNTIGQVECDGDSVVNIFVGLMQSMGMTNPVSLHSTAGKAVTITKKNNKYKLVLNAFKPPVEIVWSEDIPLSQIKKVIDDLVSNNRKVGYISFLTTSDRGKVFQLGIN